jgi:hypothetical protein
MIECWFRSTPVSDWTLIEVSRRSIVAHELRMAKFYVDGFGNEYKRYEPTTS